MARDTSSRHEAIWRGHYYRPEYESYENIISGNVERGQMWWQRSNPRLKLLSNRNNE